MPLTNSFFTNPKGILFFILLILLLASLILRGNFHKHTDTSTSSCTKDSASKSDICSSCSHSQKQSWKPFDDQELHSASCFCKLKGKIDDCECNINTVDHFNNIKIYPRLKSLLVKNYFKFFRVNLDRGCPFWPDDSRCSIRDCSVKPCPEDKLPPGLHYKPENKYAENIQEEKDCDENYKGLGVVDETISDESYKDFERWQKHDDSQDMFCELDDESTTGMQYVDLLLNPERYTGYQGASAHRIWKSIYEENCFKPESGRDPFITSHNINDLCLEKRVFYRAISGLHTSINIHLCSQYYYSPQNNYGPGRWGTNAEEFHKRFDPYLTTGEGPQRLRNLYFIYLLELRALAKVAPYLNQVNFYTGIEEEDKDLNLAVQELLTNVVSFPDHFDESIMFRGDKKEALKLKEEFKQHFRNISRIMDCVGCDKCRMWGKLQVQGLGTALKILFSGDFSPAALKHKRFHLTRTEIVSLFNAFGRISNSVYQLENFRKHTSSSQESKI